MDMGQEAPLCATALEEVEQRRRRILNGDVEAEDVG